MYVLRKQGSLFPWDYTKYGCCQLERLLAIFAGHGEEAICRTESEASHREKWRREADESFDIL